MIDKEGGDFGGNYEIPSSIALDREAEIRTDTGEVTKLYSQLQFAGKRKFASEQIYNPFKNTKRRKRRDGKYDDVEETEEVEEPEDDDNEFDWEELDDSSSRRQSRKDRKRQRKEENEGNDRRSLQDAEDGAAYITNPVICTSRGSALLFENLSAEKYPIYVKDSLLNTNDNFDYGEFDALSSMLSTDAVKSFVFTFQEPGIYVFADSRNTAKQMIIAVMGDGKACPSETDFSPQTYASLIKVGAFRREVLQPPHWWLFFGVLLAFCTLILGAVALIAYIFKKQWKSDAVPKIAYQRSNYRSVENDDVTDKDALVSLNTESSSFLFRHQGRDEEEEEAE